MEALPEIDKKLWQQDPNAYARNYYKLTSKITVECDCGQKIKKCHYTKHLKSSIVWSEDSFFSKMRM